MKHSVHVRLFFLIGLITAVSLSIFLLFTASTSPTFAGGSCNPIAGSSTIQAAIDNGTCTTITVGAGTYTENLTISRNVTIRGAGTTTIVDGGGNGRVLTIDGNVTVYLENLRFTNGDATSEGTESRSGGGILVNDGATLHGTNLYIDDNIASTAAQTGFGGGVAIIGANAYITQTTITVNFANRRAPSLTGGGEGGGLYISGNSTLQLTNSNILTNVAAYAAGDSTDNRAAGGGLFQNSGSTSSIVNLNHNRWTNNVARGPNSDPCDSCIGTTPAGDGGAIAVVVAGDTAQLYVDGDTFTQNVANASLASFDVNEYGRGGAISILATNDGQITGTITSATMMGNYGKAGPSATGEGRGGAIHVRQGTLIVDKSVILDNVSNIINTNGFGGGIYVREPAVGDYTTVTNSVIAGNSAANLITAGAQIHIDYISGNSNKATILNNTLADDTQTYTLAFYYNGTSAGDHLTLGNTIIANHINGVGINYATGMARPRYLLFYNVTNDKTAATGGFPGDDETTWTTGDPLFVNAVVGNYHLSSTASAAFNTGTNEAGFYTDHDLDGDARPVGTQYDIGADELNYPIYLPIIIK